MEVILISIWEYQVSLLLHDIFHNFILLLCSSLTFLGGIPGMNVISAAPLLTGAKPVNPTGLGGAGMPGPNIGLMGNPMMGGIFNPAMMGAGMANMGQPGFQMNAQKSAADNVDPALRKVFIKNVPPEIPDSFMETILKVRFSDHVCEKI